MALGDSITVLIDVGQAKPREEKVEAGSAGGTVDVKYLEGTYRALELSRNGRVVREVIVNPDRLVALIVAPKRR